MQDLILTTSDHQSIYCTVFLPSKDCGKIVIINSATGVKQQIYFAFSKYLATQGFTVITYDYRGIGLSKPSQIKGYTATMRDWGTKDFGAVTNYVKTQFPQHQKFLIGHSVGALIVGMNDDSIFFEKFIFIATQNAYYGHLNFKTKIAAFLGFSVVQPLTTGLLGYFPGHYLGLGESLPSGVSRDWAHLILKKKSTDYLLENAKVNISKTLSQNVFVLYAEDDDWLTDRGVRSLLEDTYPQLQATYRVIKTSESEVKQIGHVNFFRSYNRRLWTIVKNELN